LKLFVDTWGWLVLADSHDPSHVNAVLCYKEYGRSGGGIVTSNFVLSETFTLLFRRRPFKEAQRFASGLLESPFIRVESVTEDRFKKAFELRKKYSDKPTISFTDLSSMRIMVELKITDVLTADSHFGHVGLGFRLLPE
jgi:uncharacterized protein